MASIERSATLLLGAGVRNIIVTMGPGGAMLFQSKGGEETTLLA